MKGRSSSTRGRRRRSRRRRGRRGEGGDGRGKEEDAEKEERSSPPRTAATNAERLWELQRELAKELVFSKNDTASKKTVGTPREEKKNSKRIIPIN